MLLPDSPPLWCVNFLRDHRSLYDLPMLANDRLRLINVKIQRAYKHIEDLEDASRPFVGPVFKTVSLQSNPQTGKPGLHFGSMNIYTSDIPAIAGDAVHNLKSALDHLAFQLVCAGTDAGIPRAGRWEDIQFPIAYSADGYEGRKLRYIEGARREAIEVVDRLKPYKGGNDALWLLYKLDNADKHSFIFPVGEDFIMDGAAFKADDPFFTSLDASEQKQNVNLPRPPSPSDPPIGRGKALLPTLHHLAEIVDRIVAELEPFLG
jgi:hypothetical protein